jgi:spore maturation protein CgeB
MFLDRNLGDLKAVDGRLAELVANTERGDDLAFFPSKAGPPSLKSGGVALHSLYDPRQEAKEWVAHHRGDIEKASGLVVLGFGLGYHVAELLQATDKPVTVFEPRADVLRAALEATDLSAVIPRIRIVTGCDAPALSTPFRVLNHFPSVRLSQAHFGKVARRLGVLQEVAKGLRIAVVGPFYGGSLPIAGYCADALLALGNEVEFIDNRRYAEAFLSIDGVTESRPHREILRKKFEEFASEAAMARCVAFRPDLVLALAQAPLSKSALAMLGEQGIPTAFWFVEDFRHMGYWRTVAPLYDFFFTIQKGEFHDRLREAGARNVSVLPLAASAEIHGKEELSARELQEFGGDVSFVGAGYYNRRKLFEGLVDLDFGIWGNDWGMCDALRRFIRRDGARVPTEDIVKIFNASRININLHSSTYHEGVDPAGDFVNPRTFEIASCGGFQLVDYRSDLADFFEIGKEIVCFENLGDLRDKIAYYLGHPQEREAIAERGRRRARRDHTYERRMEAMIDFIVLSGFETPWMAMRRKEDPGRLVGEAGPETELGKYLARFADLPSLKLQDVVRKIRSCKGDLSRVERIFLALNEIGK